MALGNGASKIEINEEAPSIRQIEGVQTSVAGFIGITERGPVGVPMQLTSFEEYRKTFGGDIANGDTSHAVRGFFEEGGQRCWVVRTLHYTDVSDSNTATGVAADLDLATGATAPSGGTVLGTNIGPFDLTPGDTLILSIDGGGNLTATFNATAASRQSGAENFALSNGQTLTVAIDGGAVQTIAFLTSEFVSIGAATAEEVANVINAKITGAQATVTSGGTRVTITSDRLGTGSGVNITGGTANGVLGFTTGNIAGTGNVSNINAVTVAEIKTIVELAVAGCTVANAGGAVRITSNTTGGSSSVQVIASSTADDELGLDNAVHTGSTGSAQNTLNVLAEVGTYSSDITMKISDASGGDADRFDLTVYDDGVIVGGRPYTDLTMDSADARYVETVLNSTTIGRPVGLTFTDLALSGTALQRRPVNGTFGPFTGGDDGLTSLGDTDFIGSPVDRTGLYALDLVAEVSILSVPGRATSAVHNAMISYAEIWRGGSMFCVLDCPAGLTAQQMVDYIEVTASIAGTTEHAAIYWPRPTVLNPNKGVFGPASDIVVPSSGIIAGVCARTDASQPGGIYQPPAGIERGIMRSVTGFETDECKDIRKRDIVFPKRINPLTTERGKPRYIDGARTLKGNGNFPSVPERRGVIFIEQSVKNGIDYARHSNATAELRRDLDRTVENFLEVQMEFGAFRTKNPETAFYVDFGDALNPLSLGFAGFVRGRVGLATNKVGEFFDLIFTQDTRAFDQAQVDG